MYGSNICDFAAEEILSTPKEQEDGVGASGRNQGASVWGHIQPSSDDQEQRQCGGVSIDIKVRGEVEGRCGGEAGED